jgi:DNA-binding transcriptional MerR regulator
MALLPVADGARLLGVHPKTLHHWLQQANVPFTTHPTDARIKCVTEEQIQQVAALIKDGVYSSRGRIDRPPRRL